MATQADKIISKWEARLRETEEEAAATVIVSSLPTQLNCRTGSVRTREASGASVLADAMRDWCGEKNCDVAVINGGFVREDKIFPAGSQLTQADIQHIVPVKY